MSTIYIGERQSGKTTMLIEMSEKTGATIVVATYPMANYIQLLAAQMGKKIPVPITVTNYIRLLASGGLGKSEKYLVDELQMMLSAMNVEAATVDCDCIEVLRGQQKPRILNGLMGLNGEAGECIDILKKHLYQGHAFDSEHMAKELGDVAWYLAISAEAIGYDLETIFQMNIDKLRARYPDGFDAEHSLHRGANDI